MNYMAAGWKVFCDPIDTYPYNDEFFEVMNFYYLYPLEYFQNKTDECMFIKYDELLTGIEACINRIYVWLGLNITDEFSALIRLESEKAANFVSQHKYSIEDLGLTEDRIFNEFDEVFSYYEFEPHQHELPDRVMLWQLKDWRKNWKHRRLEKRANRIEKRTRRKETRRQKKQTK